MSTSVISSLSRRIINGRVISQTLKSTSSVTLPSLPIAITNHNDMKNGGGKRFFTSNVKLQQSDDSVATVSYPMKTAEIGMKAPGFTAPAVIDGEIKELSLQDYQGQYVVLLFYPKDFTFVCPTEIIAFNDRIKDFEKVNTKLIAISTDTENSHLAWTRVPRKAGGLGPMQIPLVADVKKTIASQYGTLSEAAGFAFRGLFIIDGPGNLQQSTINNFPVGRSVDETLRLIQAFQFVEKHGEVCPANWQPGDDTIVPDPEDSLKFFSNVKDPVSHKTTSIQQIKNENELNKVLKSNEKVVVDFMASWCSKCQQIAPFVEELSKKKSNVKFVQIDTSLAELKSLKEKYNVSALPTFKFFKNGNPVGTEVTGYKKQLLSETLSKLFH